MGMLLQMRSLDHSSPGKTHHQTADNVLQGLTHCPVPHAPLPCISYGRKVSILEFITTRRHANCFACLAAELQIIDTGPHSGGYGTRHDDTVASWYCPSTEPNIVEADADN